MILPFLLALLAFLALLPILSPLMKGSRPLPPRASFDQAVYRDQLSELDRDIARGLLTNAEAQAARLEIQRRMLAADRLPSRAVRLTRSPVVAAIVFLFVGLGSVGLYLNLGAPWVPDEPFSSRGAADPRTASLRQATEQLAARLKQNPSDGEGWALYGRSLAMLGDWNGSEAAYRQAIALGQNGPDVQADHAEMLVMQAGGTVTPVADAVFRELLAKDPDNAMARYYLAVAASQAGEPRKAIEQFQSLLAGLPSDSPMRPQIAQRIAAAAKAAGIPAPELAKGTAPSGSDASSMEAAGKMPDAQRQAMVRGMVESLAAKQQADPSNLDGWLRLGRAYAVLGEGEKAADAYERAAALKPDDISIPLTEARALLSQQKPTDLIQPRVVALLKRVEEREPKEPMVLWYLGIAAAQEHDANRARGYWETLKEQLAPGSDDRRMIESAIATLPKS